MFPSTELRDRLYLSIKTELEQSAKIEEVKMPATTDGSIDDFTQQWREHKITNYDYLMILNSYAQRSFQDLSQYPVMPWVLKDYQSEEINLDDPAVFRDLSRSIGAHGN